MLKVDMSAAEARRTIAGDPTQEGDACDDAVQPGF